MKKIILLMIISVFLGSVTGCIGYVKMSDGDGLVEEVETTKKLGNSRVDRANLAKDKTLVAELYHAISMIICYEEYLEIKSSGKAVAANENGEVNVAELFDTSTEVGQSAVEELNSIVGMDEYMIKFSSDFKTECTLEIVELNPKAGKVVIQFVSESYGVEFYVESGEEYEGVYGK